MAKRNGKQKAELSYMNLPLCMPLHLTSLTIISSTLHHSPVSLGRNFVRILYETKFETPNAQKNQSLNYIHGQYRGADLSLIKSLPVAKISQNGQPSFRTVQRQAAKRTKKHRHTIRLLIMHHVHTLGNNLHLAWHVSSTLLPLRPIMREV